ncbi:hypothetical protein VNO78_07212 [Psophocarpus tetragonolobus]|uniref:Uncharacterized protein n=1 Tax=Psophocarpus tetragonolobus TaxID=3891 RepID=A0AAN9SSS1_PSOTE
MCQHSPVSTVRSSLRPRSFTASRSVLLLFCLAVPPFLDRRSQLCLGGISSPTLRPRRWVFTSSAVALPASPWATPMCPLFLISAGSLS